MMIKHLILLVALYFCSSFTLIAQTDDWKSLIPLRSKRSEVEKILGKPEKYFEGSGIYELKMGEFVVWYSKGACRRSSDEIQWNIPAGIMTELRVRINKPLSLAAYLSELELKAFTRSESPAGFSRFLYTSSDESIVFETIMKNDSTEFVNSITLQPDKMKKNLRCSSM